MHELKLSQHHKASNLYSLVHLLLLPAHHHEPPPHGVEGVGHGDGAGGHGLRDAEPRQDARLLARKLLGRVVGTEVDSTVDDDTLNVNVIIFLQYYLDVSIVYLLRYLYEH